jgi:hypothetical protein
MDSNASKNTDHHGPAQTTEKHGIHRKDHQSQKMVPNKTRQKSTRGLGTTVMP